MTTLSASLQDNVRPIAVSHPKLIIASFDPLDQTSHWLNELVSFKTEGSALEMSVRILTLDSTDAHVAATLSAAPVLDPLPALDVNADNYVAQLVAFTDAADILEPLWTRLDAENPASRISSTSREGTLCLSAVSACGLHGARRSNAQASSSALSVTN